MKLLKVNVQENWEQKYKKEEFIRNIIEQIFIICRNDKNFQIENKIDLSIEIENMKTKINNKNELLTKSGEMKKTFIKKISELKNENFKVKNNLLESLGIEI